MNKIVKITGLMLIAVSTLASGMEEYRSNVYITNRLRTKGEPVSILAKVTYKAENPKIITIDKAEETKLLGNINEITKIEVVANTPATITGSIPYVGKYSPNEILAQAMKANALRAWEDITNDFIANVYPPQNNHNVMRITVDWKYPDAYVSPELKYTFKIGDFNPSITGYPWKWVYNDTRFEIQVREVIDPNSLYAQEMEEQGLSVGNPVKVAPGKGWEIFEENRRFEVYSKATFSWFEPNYADLEKQVAEGRLKKENTYKQPIISIGTSYTGGWDFRIVWK